MTHDNKIIPGINSDINRQSRENKFEGGAVSNNDERDYFLNLILRFYMVSLSEL